MDVAARYLVAYKVKRDGTPRPKSSLAKERTCLNVYVIPALGNAWIGDLDLPELNETIRALTLKDGTPASGSTRARRRRCCGGCSRGRGRSASSRSTRRWSCVPAGAARPQARLIPSIPQVLRLAEALDHFKPGLGDVAMVLAFTGLRWEEAVAVPAENVDLDGQWMTMDRTASESGGRRDVRDDMKTRAAVRRGHSGHRHARGAPSLGGGGGAGTQRRPAVLPADQRRAGRIPRIRDVAEVSGPGARLHGVAQGRRRSSTRRTSCATSAPRC